MWCREGTLLNPTVGGGGAHLLKNPIINFFRYSAGTDRQTDKNTDAQKDNNMPGKYPTFQKIF